MAAAQEKIYFVRHRIHGLAIVRAGSFEEATVAAARFWETPWRRIAWECECEREMKLYNNICPRCGRVFQGGHGEKRELCAACEKKLRDENFERRRREVKWARKTKGRKEAAT